MPESSRGLTGRLAPSPTGGLHLGHARTFLAAWLAARSAGGRVVLRVEDLDATRVRADALVGAVDDLRWLGLDWDEGPDVGGPHAPYLQSLRLTSFQHALERLMDRGLVYPCTCTRAEIARAASAPHAEDEGPSYPGTCSYRTTADAAALTGRPYTWRFRVPDGPVAWDDRVLGPLVGEPARLGGDFLVFREGSGPSYQLAVVVDDAAMGVTQVVRGLDLVPSTPRQILLHRALGHPEPEFGHLPLVVGSDGRRLAKRDGSVKLAALRSGGCEPRRLVGWLAASLGCDTDGGPASPPELRRRFAADRVPPAPFVVAPRDVLDLLAGRTPSRS